MLIDCALCDSRIRDGRIRSIPPEMRPWSAHLPPNASRSLKDRVGEAEKGGRAADLVLHEKCRAQLTLQFTTVLAPAVRFVHKKKAFH